MRSRPEWIDVQVISPHHASLTRLDDSGLDAGEKAAIELALGEPGALLLIDEAVGRLVATRLGIPNTGTLGVLVAAAKDGLVDLKSALEDLQSTNFRIGQTLISRLLATNT